VLVRVECVPEQRGAEDAKREEEAEGETEEDGGEDEWDEFTLDEKESTAPEVVSANGVSMDVQTSGSAALETREASLDAGLLRPVAAPGWLLYRNHKPCLSATSRHVEPAVPISWAPLDKSKLHVDHGMKSEADGANGIFWNCQTSEVDSSETRATSPGTVSVASEDEDDDARIQDRGDRIRCCPWPHRKLSDGKQHWDKGSVDRRNKQTSLSEHSMSRPFRQPVRTFKTPDGPRQVRGRCAIPSEPLSEARYKGFVKSFRGTYGWVTSAAVQAQYPGRDVFLHINDCDGDFRPWEGCAMTFLLAELPDGNPKAARSRLL